MSQREAHPDENNKSLRTMVFLSVISIAFSVIVGYLLGYPVTTLKPSCSDLNASFSQYQCEAIKNPTSEQGIGYFMTWVVFSPLILLMTIQIMLILKASKIILFGEGRVL